MSKRKYEIETWRAEDGTMSYYPKANGKYMLRVSDGWCVDNIMMGGCSTRGDAQSRVWEHRGNRVSDPFELIKTEEV